MSANARFQTFAMTLPEKGPIAIPDEWTFADGVKTEVDLTQLIENGWLDFVSGVYFDNTENDGYMVLECVGTIQKFYLPAKASGYVPLLLPNPPKVQVTHNGGGVVRFQWYNIPVFPISFPDPTSDTTGTDVNIVGSIPLDVVGPLTDAELRATPVPVSGTVTANTVVPIGGAWTNQSIANLTGASQTLMAANPNRRHLLIQNLDANPIGINLSGGAASLTAAGSIYLPQYGSLEIFNYPPTSAITVIGTANADVTAYEG